MPKRRLVRLVVALVVGAVLLGGVVTVRERSALEGDRLLANGSSLGADADPGVPFANRDRGDRGHPDARRIEPDDRFRRFRLDAVDGTSLTPNRDDLAARTVANGPLLLFLPATRAQPSDYTEFLTAATNAGYHVLGLDYWNLGKTLSRTCAGSPHCYTQVQRNRFDGTAPSEWSSVQPAGSVISRLRNALVHLDDADPAGGWNRFLHDDRVQWKHIVVAGHSQGGSQAAFIGHVRHVDGVLMFGAPAISDGTRHASWLDVAGKTPVDRYYGLAHRKDHFGPFIRPSWRALALDGARRPFRSRSGTPAGDPHALLTTVPVPAGTHAHSIVVSDHTPRDGLGNPVLLPVWNWMLGRFDVPQTHNATG
jgi:hypothetical protein